MKKGRTGFCLACREDVNYHFQKLNITKVIREKEYTFRITIAVCDECGEEMSIPRLMDLNAKEIDEQYRKQEELVSISDIQKLMKIYNIGKAPLSNVLGFGEITITRYLAGQMPSKEYSDIIRRALASPAYMKKLLIQNKEKIASDECQLIDRIIGSYGLYDGKVMEMITHKEDPWLEMRD